MIIDLSPIKFRDIAGTHLNSRFSGANIRRRLASRLNRAERVVLDLEGVETISEPFADECFSKLNRDLGYELIGSKAILKNASPYVEAIIISATDWQNDGLAARI